MREALEGIQTDIVKGSEDAAKVLKDIEQDYEAHKQRKANFEAEMNSVHKEVQQRNTDIDTAIFDISTNCIDKCKTGK